MLSFRRCPTTLRQTIASSLRTSTQSQTSILPRSKPSQWTQTLSQSPALLRTSAACFSTSAARAQQAPARATFEVTQESPEGVRPITKFQQLQTLGLVDEKIVSTLTRQLGFQDMTQVQSLTISEAMKGIDVLAQAKTGTGKTIAFMLPIIQRILNADPSLAQATNNFGGRDNGYGGRDSRGNNMNRGRNTGNRRGNGRSDIRAIVISPTRELAEQIAVEAKKLVSNTGVKVQVAVGGTQKSEHLRNMDREGCHILVATPGRLTDLLSDPMSRVAAPNLEALTLDEADRLMDDGFWPAIQEIQKLLPDPRQRDRQTLMFSATISREIAMLAQSVLKPDHHYVHTVSENEAPTHERVPQKLVVTNGLENDTPALYELVVKSVMAAKADGSKRPFKAIVYYNSTAEQDTTFKVFLDMKHKARQAPRDSPLNSLSGVMMLGISSRNSQAQRQRAADNFRTADSAILFSSDVTARGMDFPNVTHVIQMGIAMSSDTYVHRIGRTGRAGKEGEAWLILPRDMHNDHQFKNILRSFPIQNDNTIENAKVDLRRAVESGVYNSPLDAVQTVRDSYSTVDEEGITFAYRGMLGALQKLSNKNWLFDSATTLAQAIWGLPALPYTSPDTLRKIGLKELMSPSARSSRRGSGGRSFGGFEDRQFPPSGGRSGYGGSGGGFGGRSGGYSDRSGGFRGDRDYGRGESGGYGNRDRGGYGDRERGSFGGSRY